MRNDRIWVCPLGQRQPSDRRQSAFGQLSLVVDTPSGGRRQRYQRGMSALDGRYSETFSERFDWSQRTGELRECNTGLNFKLWGAKCPVPSQFPGEHQRRAWNGWITFFKRRDDRVELYGSEGSISNRTISEYEENNIGASPRNSFRSQNTAFSDETDISERTRGRKQKTHPEETILSSILRPRRKR